MQNKKLPCLVSTAERGGKRTRVCGDMAAPFNKGENF